MGRESGNLGIWVARVPYITYIDYIDSMRLNLDRL